MRAAGVEGRPMRLLAMSDNQPPTLLKEQFIIRPDGYALPGMHACLVEAACFGEMAVGYGEGSSDVSRVKAVSEAVERCAFKAAAKGPWRSKSSNGWACHTSAQTAVQNATLELIERDVALNSWENSGPFFVIPETIWPKPIRGWKSSSTMRAEFSNLKLLLSCSSNGCCVSALLFNDHLNFVAGHATSIDITGAMLSATLEAMRAAHSALRFEHFGEVLALHSCSDPERVFEPGVHSLAYAYTESIPDCISIDSATVSEVEAFWSQHVKHVYELEGKALKISLFTSGRYVVAHVSGQQFRDLTWGVCRDRAKSNQSPHFVG